MRAQKQKTLQIANSLFEQIFGEQIAREVVLIRSIEGMMVVDKRKYSRREEDEDDITRTTPAERLCRQMSAISYPLSRIYLDLTLALEEKNPVGVYISCLMLERMSEDPAFGNITFPPYPDEISALYDRGEKLVKNAECEGMR